MKLSTFILKSSISKKQLFYSIVYSNIKLMRFVLLFFKKVNGDIYSESGASYNLRLMVKIERAAAVTTTLIAFGCL